MARFSFYLRPGSGFNNGLAPVALNRKVGYIDTTGTFVVAPQYVYGTGFSGGFAYVYTKTRGVPDRPDRCDRPSDLRSFAPPSRQFYDIALTGAVVYRVAPS